MLEKVDGGVTMLSIICTQLLVYYLTDDYNNPKFEETKYQGLQDY